MLSFSLNQFPSKTHFFINLLMFLMLALCLSVKSAMGATVLMLFFISLNYRWNYNNYSLHKFEKLWLLLLLLYFVSSIISFYAVQFEDFELNSLDIPLRFVLVIPVFILLKKTVLNEKMFWIGSVIGSFSAGLIAVYQHFILNIVHAKGMANHHIVFGNISICLAVISCVGLIKFINRPFYIKFFFFLGILSGMTASLFSGARGGWIALPVLMLYFLWLYRSQLGINRIIIFLVSIISIVILLYQVEDLGISKRIDDGIHEVQQYYVEGQYQTSVGQRLEMFKTAWIIFTENPWLGSGVDSYIKESNRLEKEGKVRPVGDDLAHPHNEYLNSMYSRGSVGLLILLSIYLVPMVYFRNRYKKKKSSFALLGSIIPLNYMMFSLSEAMLDRMLSLMFFLMLMFYITALYHQDNEYEK